MKVRIHCNEPPQCSWNVPAVVTERNALLYVEFQYQQN
jgi:hypothetical protein